jgi:hypothetical protein
MTNVSDLPPIEKTSPPRQLVAGLARAREEALENAANAELADARARVRAQGATGRHAYGGAARRSGGGVERTEELRASMVKFTELQAENDLALATLAAGGSTTVTIKGDVVAAPSSSSSSSSLGKMSWSGGGGGGGGSLSGNSLDLLELSASSLSLSMEELECSPSDAPLAAVAAAAAHGSILPRRSHTPHPAAGRWSATDGPYQQHQWLNSPTGTVR